MSRLKVAPNLWLARTPAGLSWQTTDVISFSAPVPLGLAAASIRSGSASEPDMMA